MHCKVFMKRIFSVFCVFALVMGAVMSAPMLVQAKDKTIEELNQELADIQNRKEENQKKLDALNSTEAGTQAAVDLAIQNLDLAQQEVAAMEAKIAPVKASIAALEKQISENESKIAEIEKEIPQKEKEYEERLDEYTQRLRAMYVSGGVSTMELLFTSDDASSLLMRSEMLQKIIDKDTENQNKLIKLMDTLKAEKADLSNKKDELQASKTDLLSQKTGLDEQLSTIVVRKNDCLASKNAANAALIDLHAKTGAFSEAINDDDRTLANIQKAIDDKIDEANKLPPPSVDNGGSGNDGGSDGGSSPGGGLKPPSGSFAHPCPGMSRISCYYPSYSSGKYHSGTDFAAPSGTPIYAADNGYVFLRDNLGSASYGNYLIIKHSSGLYTLYAHTSAVFVSTGDVVTKGQKIAAVGSTGNSSGPHLHFEVRTGAGKYANCVDPANYLPVGYDK